LRTLLPCSLFPYTTLFRSILRVCRFYGRRSIAGHNGLPPPLRCSSSFLSQTRLPAREGPPRKRPPLLFIATENGISAHFSHSCSDRKSTRLNSSHVAISYA